QLIDKERLCETRFNKEKVEREERRNEKNKRQSSQNRSEGVSFSKRQVTQPTQFASQGQFRKGQGRDQSQNIPVYSTPKFSQSSNKMEIQNCATCGRRHTGECWFASKICFHCKQPGHYIKDYPQIVDQSITPAPSNTTVQMERLGGGESVGRGRPQSQALPQDTRQTQP